MAELEAMDAFSHIAAQFRGLMYQGGAGIGCAAAIYADDEMSAIVNISGSASDEELLTALHDCAMGLGPRDGVFFVTDTRITRQVDGLPDLPLTAMSVYLFQPDKPPFCVLYFYDVEDGVLTFDHVQTVEEHPDDVKRRRYREAVQAGFAEPAPFRAAERLQYLSTSPGIIGVHPCDPSVTNWFWRNGAREMVEAVAGWLLN